MHQKKKQRNILILLATVILLAGLLWAGLTQVRARNAPPTVKIGLVAPFEGLYRATGYEVLFAVKLALQERNQGQGIQGYRVELVALNDFNDPAEAAKQAQVLIADPDVVGVVGHLTSDSTLAALPNYQAAPLAVSIPWSVEEEIFQRGYQNLVSVAATVEQTNARLDELIRTKQVDNLTTLTDDNINKFAVSQNAVKFATDAVTAGTVLAALDSNPGETPYFGTVEVGNRQLVQIAGNQANGLIFVSPARAAGDIPGAEEFVEAYQNSAGLPPGPRAVLAYDATNVLLDAIESAIIINDGWYQRRPSRLDVTKMITTIQRKGLTGQLRFASTGQRIDAPTWIYQISEASYPGNLISP